MNTSMNMSTTLSLGLLLFAATSVFACEIGYKDIGDEPDGDGDGDSMSDGDGDGDGDGDPMGDGDGDPMGDGDGDPTGDGDGDGDGCLAVAFQTCEDVQGAFEEETTVIRSCTEDAECGQQLVGTSCGCTHDWVARTDADATCFYAIIEQASLLECDLGLYSDCDCPSADGFECVDNICEWSYL
ncbi:hypothetical protein [Enhygromyxa salina]|uniref:Endo-1,4-beta-xylanase A n=1 Tax=Enhygromyxa salina TaxID=215803 RepID=A0A2S9YWM1_9BACT|nr:hypothetical protein [Enhygromyxa salina]PRQ09505.1 hypothetical protein ENSA7_07470 [Enhygromyxa salina]